MDKFQMLLAFEAGYKACERGENLQFAIERAAALIDGESNPYVLSGDELARTEHQRKHGR